MNMLNIILGSKLLPSRPMISFSSDSNIEYDIENNGYFIFNSFCPFRRKLITFGIFLHCYLSFPFEYYIENPIVTIFAASITGFVGSTIVKFFIPKGADIFVGGWMLIMNFFKFKHNSVNFNIYLDNLYKNGQSS